MWKRNRTEGFLSNIFRDGSLSAPEGGVITVKPEAAAMTENEVETRVYNNNQRPEQQEETSPDETQEGTK